MHELLLQKSAFGVPDSSAEGKNGAHILAVGGAHQRVQSWPGLSRGCCLAHAISEEISDPKHLTYYPGAMGWGEGRTSSVNLGISDTSFLAIHSRN